MAKKFTKVLCALLAFVMCLGTVPAFAIGSDIEEASVWFDTTWPITKTANGLDEKDQTDVTLTVPGVLNGTIDVVFVLGGRMAEMKETLSSVINVFKPLMGSEDLTVKLGIVALEKGEDVILDLNTEEAILNADTWEDLIKEKIDYINKLPGGFTNLHSELLKAKNMLDNEPDAKAENKYLFVMATGRTYVFDNGKGAPATILSERNGTYVWGNYAWQNQRGGNNNCYVLSNDNWSAYWSKIENWVNRDGNKYVYTFPIDTNNNTAEYTFTINNSKQDRVGGQRTGLWVEDPVPAAKDFIYTNIVAGTPYGGKANGGPDYALNYEYAMYQSAQVYQSMVDSGYNCYSICSEDVNYQNNSKYLTKIGHKSSTLQIGHAFMDHLASLSGQGKAVVVYDYARDDNGNYIINDKGRYVGEARENFFAPVVEDMLFTTSTGTTVEDFIGKNENGNFEFIQDPTTIKLVVGDYEYTTEQIIPANEGATASYQFTTTEPGKKSVPTFWLDYYYGDGVTTERFVWTFGEDVSMHNLASLTYKLQLTEKLDEEGTYTVPTNNSATLYPVDSDGNPGKPQLFPVPEVEYEVVPYDVDIVLALGAGIAQYDADCTYGTNTYDAIVSLVEPLINQGINVKLGLIAVEHYDDVALPLTVLTKDNYETVITDGLNNIQNMPAGPTNLHGNIVAAKEMLDADTSVPAANKFFHVIATGRTYNYDNADGVPTTIVNKVSLKGKTYYYWGHYLWQSQRGQHTSLYMIPDRYNNSFESYWKDVEKWVAADGDTYAYSFTDAYDVSNPQWFNTFYNANNKDAKALDLASSRFGWIMNPLTKSGHAAIGSGADPQNALNYERAQYEAYQAYEAMKKTGYNCYALCSENTSYQNGSPYIKVAKYTGTSTIQLGHSFMNFLAGGEAPLLFVMTDPNTGASEMAKNFFAPVDTSKLVKSTEKALTSSALSLRNSAAKNAVASVSVEAEGDALTYKWYYKNQDSDEFTLSSFTGADFRAVMSSDYDGMQVYCVITDQYNNSTTTEVVTLNLD